MPQMSPMSWLLLMMIFIISFIIMMTIMYFNDTLQKLPNMNKSSLSSNNSFIWKW
uniref:ATP synthase complex subunit 8 n=1 Tax=Meloimorpha japonica TaxID=1109092 RepID=A0A385I1Y1_9ORTH|nr:ATP synthase F0 subunit 8 [Meloimorpha japonica]AXY63914.1 ATP synthase F0 subunit 8 [Meloimorpha japonica]